MTSVCDYKALPITLSARFRLRITESGVNKTPGGHEWIFHLDLNDDDQLVLKAPLSEGSSAGNPLAFAEALARNIEKRAGRVPEARTLESTE